VADIREIEGVGYHDLDHDGDYLLVERWIKRPEDLKGQSLTVAKLLPPEFRGGIRTQFSVSDNGRGQSRKFRFHISIEIEIAKDQQDR
jgi:hypothetical protein